MFAHVCQKFGLRAADLGPLTPLQVRALYLTDPEVDGPEDVNDALGRSRAAATAPRWAVMSRGYTAAEADALLARQPQAKPASPPPTRRVPA